MFGFKVYCDLRYSEIRVALSKLEKTILNEEYQNFSLDTAVKFTHLPFLVTDQSTMLFIS